MLEIYSERKCRPRFVKSPAPNGSLGLTHFLGVQHSCIGVTPGRTNRTWIGKTAGRCWYMRSLFPPSGGHSIFPNHRGWRQGGSYWRTVEFMQCWPIGPHYLCEEFEGLAVCAASFHIAPSSVWWKGLHSSFPASPWRLKLIFRCSEFSHLSTFLKLVDDDLLDVRRV